MAKVTVDYDGVVRGLANGFSREETALNNGCSASHVGKIYRALVAAKAGNAACLAFVRNYNPSLAEWAEQFYPNGEKLDNTEQEKTELDHAIERLCEKFREAELNPYIVKPLAYALYYTWREVDEHGEKV